MGNDNTESAPRIGSLTSLMADRKKREGVRKKERERRKDRERRETETSLTYTKSIIQAWSREQVKSMKQGALQKKT
jgi:hypothetical protein